MRKSLPEEIRKVDLNSHQIHDTVATIIAIEERFANNPHSEHCERAKNFGEHIYRSMFEGKETTYTFFLTIGYMLSIAHSEIEKKFGVDVPQANIPKGENG